MVKIVKQANKRFLYERFIQLSPSAYRKRIIEKTCLLCGCEDCITVDHIISLYDGGTNRTINYQPLCCNCNRAKGSLSIDFDKKLFFNTPKVSNMSRFKMLEVSKFVYYCEYLRRNNQLLVDYLDLKVV